MTIPQRNKLAGRIGMRSQPQRQQLRQQLLCSLAEGMTLANEEKTMWAILLQDASHPGKYRYQLFDETGFYFHRTFDTLQQAFDDAFETGFSVLDMGAMTRLFGTDEWKKGMRIEELQKRDRQGPYHLVPTP